MNGTNVFRILMVIVLLGAIAVAGVYVYNIGLVQGRTESAPLPGQEPGGALPYYGFRPAFWPLGYGFGCFGLLFLLIPIFFLTRLLFWWPRGRWGWYDHGERRDVPRRFEEWHQKMHEGASEEQRGTRQG